MSTDAGRWRSPSYKLGSQRCGGRAGSRLKPDVTVMIGGVRPARLGVDVVNLDDMREFISICLGYDQHMHVTIVGGRNSVLARRRE